MFLKFHVIVPIICKMGMNIVTVCFSFVFLFSAQNQLPQIIIGMGWVIYKFKHFQSWFERHKNFQVFLSFEKGLFIEFFLFFLSFWASRANEPA